MPNEIEQQILKFLSQQQSPEPSDSQAEKVVVIRFVHDNENVISESTEKISLDERGILKNKTEEVQRLLPLSDGCSLNKLGVDQCQTCHQIISRSNIHRCWCGRTTCISRGCGKSFSKDGKLCCSRWHAFLSWLGFTRRW